MAHSEQRRWPERRPAGLVATDVPVTTRSTGPTPLPTVVSLSTAASRPM